MVSRPAARGLAEVPESVGGVEERLCIWNLDDVRRCAGTVIKAPDKGVQTVLDARERRGLQRWPVAVW
ncbi:hypothetical protein MTO96_011443 [Rhipicephalus appendiculatus]